VCPSELLPVFPKSERRVVRARTALKAVLQLISADGINLGDFHDACALLAGRCDVGACWSHTFNYHELSTPLKGCMIGVHAAPKDG